MAHLRAKRVMRPLPLEHRLFVGMLPKLDGELHHIVVDCLFFLHLIVDSGASMHHGGVIPASEHLADVDQAHTGHFSGQIHGHLSRERYVFCARSADQIIECQVEVLGHLANDVSWTDLYFGGEEILERLFG